MQPLRSGMKQVDTGGLSFQEIREDGKYYVDKSLLIKDLLETNDRGVYLYTRPRRFGKTTNITMLDAFFNLEYKGNTWFDGLAISDCQQCEQFRNRFPVVLFDLKELTSGSDTDFGYFMTRIRKVLSDLYCNHDYLLESPTIKERDEKIFNSIVDMNADDGILVDAVKDLSGMLHRHFGSRAVVLIDEYDQAITRTFGSDVQKRILGFLRGLLSNALKSNEHLQMAYITGVMQVAKADIFSGLNNLTVNNVFSIRSDERFGFTEDEVEMILEYYGHSERIDEVRSWYDGYRFGNAEVYNPFSVMMYVQNGFIPKGYWIGTSSDNPVRWLLRRGGCVQGGVLRSAGRIVPQQTAERLDIQRQTQPVADWGSPHPDGSHRISEGRSRRRLELLYICSQRRGHGGARQDGVGGGPSGFHEVR